jgi:hypothetical protein
MYQFLIYILIMSRKICDVLEKIYKLIPKDRDDKLKNDLDKLLTSMSYSAPEKILSDFYWVELQIIINNNITKDNYYDKNNSYYKKIINIFINKN